MDDLLQEFIAETRETLAALSGEIVAWEADPGDRARLDAIFRFVHTVKGSCGFLDLPRLARLSHAAEDVLAAVRDGARVPDAALVTAVLRVVDRIGELVEAIEAEVALDDSGEDALIAALEEGAEIAVPAQSTGLRAPSRSVRLNVELLDRLMSGMSDMVLARNELARRMRDGAVDPAMEASLERLSATVADMRDTVTRTRMQTIDALFSALPRIVRDTAGMLGKAVQLRIEGADVELDREMIEALRDPLLHIVRNAIDHGIEGPAARRAAGKRETGRLTVCARQSGNQIIVDVSDDGAGIDVDRVIAKLASQGRDRTQLMALSDRAKLDLVFQPGLSTAEQVTEISGRGVGMDVVRASVEQIGGRIELDNAPGRGLRLSIHVPLTLSIIPTIIVGCGAHRFALPRQSIEEILNERAESVRIDTLGDRQVVTVRDRRMPLVDLADRLGIDAPPVGGRKLVIVGIGAGSYVIAVDTVLDAEELVIKPAAPPVMAAGIYAGQTLPDSGLPMLLLDCAGIAADAGIVFDRETAFEDEVAVVEQPGEPMMIFRDLDDVVRAIPLVHVDRVEKVPSTALAEAAGRLRLLTAGGLVPVFAVAPPDGRASVGILRIKDGDVEIAYAMAEPIDIVAVSDPGVPAATPGPVATALLLGGEPVEVLDPFWLLGSAADGGGSGSLAAPLVLVGEDSWLQRFVRPMLERAGYRVAERASADELPAARIVLDDPEAAAAAAGPVVHLRGHSGAAAADAASVYRYDRAAILAAVARAAGGGW